MYQVFPVLSIKKMLGLLKYKMLAAIHQIFTGKHLPVSQRLEIICLISKGDKDKKYPTNWRPLMLLETFYKLIKSIFAKTLNPLLENLLVFQQKTYIPGRYTSKWTIIIYDLYCQVKENNLKVMIILIDLKKLMTFLDFILTILNIF